MLKSLFPLSSLSPVSIFVSISVSDYLYVYLCAVVCCAVVQRLWCTSALCGGGGSAAHLPRGVHAQGGGHAVEPLGAGESVRDTPDTQAVGQTGTQAHRHTDTETHRQLAVKKIAEKVVCVRACVRE